MTWEAVLDGLGATDNWEPPAGLGPLPEALTERAQHVLALLAQQIQALEARLTETGEKLAASAGACGAPASSTPRFLDTRA